MEQPERGTTVVVELPVHPGALVTVPLGYRRRDDEPIWDRVRPGQDVLAWDDDLARWVPARVERV